MEKTNTQIGLRVTTELKQRIEVQAQKEKRNTSNFIIKVVTDYLEMVEEESRKKQGQE